MKTHNATSTPAASSCQPDAVRGDEVQGSPVVRLGGTLPSLKDLEDFKALSLEERLVVVNALNTRMGAFLSAGFGGYASRLEIVSSLHPYLESQIRVAPLSND